jgi:hypothetical protein
MNFSNLIDQAHQLPLCLGVASNVKLCRGEAAVPAKLLNIAKAGAFLLPHHRARPRL